MCCAAELIGALLTAPARAHVPVIYVTGPDEDWCAVINGTVGSDIVMLEPGEYLGPCDIVAEPSNQPGEQTTVQSFDPKMPAEFVGSAADYVLHASGESVVLLQLEFRDLPEHIDAVRIGDIREAWVRGGVFRDLPGRAIVQQGLTEQLLISDAEFCRVGVAVTAGCADGSCAVPSLEIQENLVVGALTGIVIEPGVWGVLRDNVLSEVDTALQLSGTPGGELVAVGGLYEARGAAIEVLQGPVTVTTNVSMGQPAIRAAGEGIASVQVVANTLVGELDLAGWGAGRDLRLVDNAVVGALPSLAEPGPGNVACDEACFTDLAGWDFYPAEGSPLRGAAAPDPGLGADWCGRVRNDAPCSGAVEAYDTPSFGALQVGFKDAFDCTLPSEPEPPGPPGPPAEPGDPDPAIVQPPQAGCSCAAPSPSPSPSLGLLLGLLVLRSRGRR
jgi:hypothetical protein